MKESSGANTIIPHDLKLLMMDCFETLVELDDAGVYRPRRGITRFLDHWVGTRSAVLAVVSDAALGPIEGALRQAGLAERVDEVFHAGNAAVALGDGRFRKDLSVPLARYGADLAHSVYIGDSPSDAEAAAHYRIPFVRVPRSEDRSFTFAQLIGGASRYDSSEFSQKMLDFYLKDRK